MNEPVNVVVHYNRVKVLHIHHISIHIGTCEARMETLSLCVYTFPSIIYIVYKCVPTDMTCLVLNDK